MNNRIINLLVLITFLSTGIKAATFTSVSSGKWESGSTWDQGSAPGVNDDVVINGDSVIIDNTTGSVTVTSITLTNQANTGLSKLYINGSITVTVNGTFTVTAENITYDVEVAVRSTALLDINGNFGMSRASNNNTNNKCRLYIYENARVEVSQDFTYDYVKAKGTEAYEEISLEDNAKLTVTGDVTFYQRNYNNFELHLYDASQMIVSGNLSLNQQGGNWMVLELESTAQLRITEDFTMSKSGGVNHLKLLTNTSTTLSVSGTMYLSSTTTDKTILVDINGSSTTASIAGNISMSATSEGDINMQVRSGATINLGGQFLRPTNFGSLDMDSGTTINFTGSNIQKIAADDLTGSGSDDFSFGKNWY